MDTHAAQDIVEATNTSYLMESTFQERQQANEKLDQKLQDEIN